MFQLENALAPAPRLRTDPEGRHRRPVRSFSTDRHFCISGADNAARKR
jgi:hypothetical protein